MIITPMSTSTQKKLFKPFSKVSICVRYPQASFLATLLRTGTGDPWGSATRARRFHSDMLAGAPAEMRRSALRHDFASDLARLPIHFEDFSDGRRLANRHPTQGVLHNLGDAG